MNIVDFVEPHTAVWIVTSLSHVFWQGTLLAGLAMIASRTRRPRSSQARYFAYCVGLFMTAGCVPLNLWLLAPEATPPVATAGSTDGTGNPVGPATRRHAVDTAKETQSHSLATRIERNSSIAKQAPSQPMATGTAHWTSASEWMLVFYLCGMVGMSARLMIGLYGSRRLCAAATPVSESTLWALLVRLRQRVGMRVLPVVACSTRVTTPLVVGVVKPAILLPVTILGDLTPGQIESILLHELAHIRRFDHVVNLLQRIVETILFFHPGVWWMSHKVSLEREHCCDDLALAWGCEPCDYAESLVRVSELRLRATGLGADSAAVLAATGRQPTRLHRRVLRVLGTPFPGPNPGLTRRGLVLLLSLAVSSAAMVATRAGYPEAGTSENSVDFDLENPPSGYEVEVRSAKRDHSIKAGGLWFRLSDIARSPDGSLEASMGLDDGYEVVLFRLFNHETRKLVHDSQWQFNPNANPSTCKFHVMRVGESDRIRIEDTGGTLPATIDLWLRIVENGPGERILIPARQGAAGRTGATEVVVTSLFPGHMPGKSSPSGRMVWDVASAEDTAWRTTVELENRGKPLRGRYHLVAVTKNGWRHAMDHTHFRDFSRRGRHTYFQLDVPLDQIDHFELLPFKARHKFFFNGVQVPAASGAGSASDRPETPSAVAKPASRGTIEQTNLPRSSRNGLFPTGSTRWEQRKNP